MTHVRPDPRFTESLGATGHNKSPGSSTSNGGQEFGAVECPVEPGVYPPYPAVEDVRTISGMFIIKKLHIFFNTKNVK